jgi:hypothetical protein
MNLIGSIEQEEIARLGKQVPAFAPGDTVVVSVNVVEGDRKRSSPSATAASIPPSSCARSRPAKAWSAPSRPTRR